MAAEKIRIEDLAKPVLTEAQQQALAHGEQTEVELSVPSVLSAAVERTGLEDFGPDDFRERLALWLSEMDEDPERTGLGRMIHWNDCVRYAANRLRMHDLVARHPEIHDQEIRQPIIVVGLPRSGTTHLVNLIAADQRLRSIPLWESQEPVPDPREKPGPGGVDPRYQRSADSWEMLSTNSPLIAAMHPMEPDHIHEELELMCPDFTSYNIEWISRAPRWRDYYLAHDQTANYAYLKTALKILQWYRPRDRWVLKCPQHLEQLGPLMKTFPDATIVMTHRDPVSVIQSAATITAYGARVNYREPRPEWYLDYWADRMRRLLEASVRDRHLIPSERCYDVLFHEFMADDVATVERIYEVADLPMTPEARGQIETYMREHPRGKHGQVVYDVREDFGADPAKLREPYGFYLDRFAVREEVR
ncbi:MAG: sulfotransferase [Myxococcales bacterium]|nr:sulfotransferase [Myxococcales bacterium]